MLHDEGYAPSEVPSEWEGEFSLEQPERWKKLKPKRGQVIQVVLGDLLSPGDAHPVWLFVMDTEVLPDGGLKVEVESLGGSESRVSRKVTLDLKNNATVHICPAPGCEGGEYAYHLKHLTVMHGQEIDPQNLGSTGVKKWVKLMEEVCGINMEEEMDKLIAETQLAGPENTEHPAPEVERDVRKMKEREREKPSDTHKQRRDHLKERLTRLKALHFGGAMNRGAGGEPSAAREEGRDKTDAKRDREDREEDARKILELARKETKRRKTPDLEEKMERGGLGAKLLARAVEKLASRRETSKKRKKRDTREDRVVTLLKKVLVGKKDKDKKRKRRKGRKGTKGRSGGGSGGTSPGSSSEGSQESSEEEDLESKSKSDTEEEKYKAPLKKRSEKTPGSVMKLLIERIEESLAEIQPSGTSSDRVVLEGPKLIGYYNLVLRTKHRTQLREMRELYLMANIIDMVRSGEVLKAMDMAAARFFSLEQALQDGGWEVARHLEIAVPEESSITGPAMALEAMKYGKMIEKARGGGGSTMYNNRGKGKGQWGSWTSFAAGGEKGEKGEKGQKDQKGGGKKGKGKNRPGWYDQSYRRGWDSQVQKPKEREEERTKKE